MKIEKIKKRQLVTDKELLNNNSTFKIITDDEVDILTITIKDNVITTEYDENDLPRLGSMFIDHLLLRVRDGMIVYKTKLKNE